MKNAHCLIALILFPLFLLYQFDTPATTIQVCQASLPSLEFPVLLERNQDFSVDNIFRHRDQSICSSAIEKIPLSFNTDDWDQNYTEYATQLQLYIQENPSCACYFPTLFRASWDIRRSSFYAFADLIWNHFGLHEEYYFQFYNFNNQEHRTKYDENSFEYIFRYGVTQNITDGEAHRHPENFRRLYFALFKNAFFYSQYRAILLDFALHNEAYPFAYSRSLTDGLNAIYSYLGDLQHQFFMLYNQCLSEHPHPKIYYERGMIHAHRGDWDYSIEDIKSAINLLVSMPVDNILSSALYLQEGSYYAEQGLYDQAIIALTEAIAKNPANKEAYFERASAYFEKMEFDLAIKDYLASELRPSLTANENIFSIDYAKGLIKGVQKGVQYEFAEALPCWAPLMSMGLWVLNNSPIPSTKFIAATLGCVAAVSVTLAADHIVSELKELVTNWDKLSQMEKGELTGFLIGKYGVDIFATYGSAKCMDAYQALSRANKILTFELMLADKSNYELIAKKVTEQLSKRPKGKCIQAFNESRILKDKEKMKHIFAEKHKLEKLGEPKIALKKITDAVFQADIQGKIPQSGVFDIVVTVDGHSVNVRGAIVHGELRYGTMFILE